MKLWQAIQKGSEGAYQVYGQFTDNVGGVCAQGAALKALGKLSVTWPHTEMASHWPHLADRVERCPAGCDLSGPLLGRHSRLIAHVNNHHKWSFNAIIEWLKGIEGDVQP